MIAGIVAWIVLGLLIGFVGTWFINVRNDDPRVGIAVAVIAAVIGGWVHSMISGTFTTSFNFWSLLSAGIGAMVALVIWHITRWRAAFRS